MKKTATQILKENSNRWQPETEPFVEGYKKDTDAILYCMRAFANQFNSNKVSAHFFDGKPMDL